MKAFVKGLFAASLLVASISVAGCGKAATCEAVADHIIDLQMNSKEAKEMPKEALAEAKKKLPEMKKEIVAECKEKKPSEKMLKCAVAAKDMEALDKCEDEKDKEKDGDKDKK